MILTIILLILGILGFVKGRINVSKNRELRGGGMYAVATLFCLPLPLSFLLGMVLVANTAGSGRPVDRNTILIADLVSVWGPLVVALILAFTLAKPKLAPGQPGETGPRGFEVKR